jgi:hypothetical protein
MRRLHKNTLSLVSIVILHALPLHAEVLTPVEGGPGGAAFRAVCPAGTYAVGIEGRFGAWLDAIAPSCAAFDPDGGFGNRVGVAKAGGPGGGPAIAYCPEGEALTSVTIETAGTYPVYVDNIRANCRIPGTDTGGGFFFGDPREEFGTQRVGTVTYTLRCPLDHVVMGFHGRAGSYVDALGLVCAERPAAKLTAAPPGIRLKPQFDVRTVTPRAERMGSTTAAATPPAPPAPAPTAPVRHERPVLLSDAGEPVRLDYCLNFADVCGEPAASAWCRATDPSRPQSIDAPLDFGVGRTFTIGDRQLCEAENCSSFTYVACATQ